MTTGYCERLKAQNFNLAKWLKEDAIRAMGVCVMLRDDGNLSESEIKDRMQFSDTGNYHQKELEEAKSKLTWTEERWELEYNSQKEKAEKRYQEEKKQVEYEQNGFRKARIKLKELLNKATSEVEIGTLNFAIKQVGVPLEYSNIYKASIIDQSIEEWKISQMKSVEGDIEYHTKELNEEIERENSRYQSYKEFCNFVDNNLGEENE
jgi:hypothetical protein